ncbi:MAG: Fibronectin, type domain protein [Bryobacterales bacterium]|nr:Fibronectin, type domain protein [Bryobacterales bacterium]
MKAWLALFGAAVLSACGYVGPPMPPTLDIPATIRDFRAWEYGDNIEIEFTLPDKTTENLPLTSVRSIELRVVENASDGKLVALPISKPGPVISQVPARDWIGKTILLSVRATGPKGKPSAWSNPASLEVIRPLAPPTIPKAQNVGRGVELTWTGPGPRYRIFRAEGDGQPQPLADSDVPSYLDDSTIYGTRYRYMVQTIAGDKQWSVVSEAGEITPTDTFSPAVPEGLSAVPTPQSIELAWTRNTEADFRGYNVFRAADNGPFQKVASLIEAPTFSDSKIESGKKYRYTVSAVDLTGNESAQSAPVEAAAQ